MDREKAKDVCGSFGRPVIKNEDGKNIAMARAGKSTVERIEGMGDEELIESAKSLYVLIYEIGQCSINDLQKEQLYNLELDKRDLLGEFREKIEEIREDD